MIHAPHRRPPETRFNRTERLVGVVVTLLIVSIVGIYATLFAFHHATASQIAAENCVSAKCESPAVKAVISQAIAGVVAAVTTANQGELTLLCSSLANLNTTNPSAAGTRALHTYCTSIP